MPHYQEKPDIRSEAIDKWQPRNDSQYLGGILVISLALLVAYGMYLYNKSKSPSAQAEANLKIDLTKELTDFKGELNGKHANLDKRVSLNEQKTNNLETNLNQQFTGLHVRFNKFEESLLLLVTNNKKD